MSDINIFNLGGQDENGKNSHVIEIGKDIFVVNAGIKIPIKNLNGIDGIIPNFDYLKKHKKDIKGVFITHAHDDAFAALPWMIMDLPGITIYASAYTAKLIENRVSKYKLGHKDYKIEIIKPNQKIGNTTVKSFEVANSISGSLGFSFETPKGDIVVMSNNTLGDLGIFGKTDLEAIKKVSPNVFALLLDARLSNFKGHSFDKKSVVNLIEKTFINAKDDERIIVGAYDEEVFTLHEVIQLAQKYNRPIISYGRAFSDMYESIDGNTTKFENYQKANDIKNAVVLVTGTWSRLYQRFVRIADNNDVYMKFKNNDHIIMLAPPVNGMEVVYADSMDEVAKKSPDILDISDKDFYKLRPAEDDIKEIVKTLKPKFFMPISALYRYLVVATKAAIASGVTQDKNIVLPNGRIAHFKDGELASQKAFIKNYGDIIIDGFGVGDVSYEVINERQTLATGGLVSVAAQIDRKTKKLIGEINIQCLGLVVKEDLKFAQEEINKIVIQKIEEAERFDHRELQNSIRKRVRRVMLKIYDKEPLVVITFFEV